MNNTNTDKKERWESPEIILINTDKINQEISKQDAELINLLSNDENGFKFLTGSVG